MALLANCWLIIEIFLIPDGLIKWFFLSFYIHPFFLFFCQIFLWIKTLQRWIFLINHYLFSHVHGVLTRFLIITRSFSRFNHGNSTETQDEDLWHEVSDSIVPNTTHRILFLCHEGCSKITKVAFCDVHTESVNQETMSVCSSSDIDGESTSFSGASSPISSYSFDTHGDMEVISNTPSSSCTLLEDEADIDNDGATQASFTPSPIVKPEEGKEEEKDSFYKAYRERMNWFDLLNQERTCGLQAFTGKELHSGGEERILKSLESDFEMVYVAQSCLSWEALHDQYRKLESIVASCADGTCASPYGALCSSTVALKFQRFQILLERFMEDERFESGKRYWNFIQRRSSLKSLLLVPYVSENSNHKEEEKNKGLMIRATDVLKAIEKCMKTFESFIEVDKNKAWWKTSNRLSWRDSPLEDPQDFNLYHDLTSKLRQKELWMKDLKGKNRCWLRKRVKPLEDSQKKDMMFATIELKLVSRVLMMSVISTHQLHWCQQKLDNIDFTLGRITRSCYVPLLFPPS
ncbi:hypothetical protein L1887_31760 [Cichorium endivia]|nr:hypothetical protein L1887_31760 [Cichorium endivia]